MRSIPARFRASSLDNWIFESPESMQSLRRGQITIRPDREPHRLRAKRAVLRDGRHRQRPPGSGVLKIAAAAGYSAMWRSSIELYQELADAVRNDKKHSPVYRRLREPAVLCLSDPIEERNWSQGKAHMLATIVKSRSDQLKSTWITCNLADGNQAAELAGAEVWDRLRGDAIVFYMKWPSYRTRHKSVR